ncbi:transglycosylase family protein [Xylanimonas sp. McL0601]|uniref:transglycosylase family protein n=1 Tax=Xylanimonas sp. McL0601 TaxID=3414739 RepID=UPI003CEA2B8D
MAAPKNAVPPVLVPLAEEPERPARRGLRRGLAAGLAAVALLAGAATGAVADARKTVTLDVDGQVTRVSTFAGSVEGLLRGQGVRLGKRDAVAPGLGARLRDGADVVVRYGRRLTVETDGKKTTTWVTAVDADDALRRLSARGADVRLMASRSGDRAALPLPLAADGGAVAVVADGRTRTVPDSGKGIEALLDRAGVSVDADDLVSVVDARDADAAGAKGAEVALWVQRVETKDRAQTSPIPFQHVEKRDPTRYSDLAPTLVQAGVAGVHTRVERVTTVDGTVTGRLLLSEGDTKAPVDEVVAVGTKERPVAPPPVPTGSHAGTQQPSPQQPSPAQPGPAAPPAPPSGDVWAALAQCESGGRADAVSSNGLYFGLYQFTVSTWRSLGGSGLPSGASPAEQTQRAQALQARSGWGQWPACARKLGLL